MKIRPWGRLNWILPKMGVKDWHVIACSSCEERSVALVEWMRLTNQNIQSSALFCIENPLSDAWKFAKPLRDESFQKLFSWLNGANCHVVETSLLDSPRLASIDAVDKLRSGSVVLDITTFPKRYFLYILHLLMLNKSVENLLVTYSKALSYPELALCADSLPPSPFPGYVRIDSKKNNRFFISVGYTALSVESLLEDAKSSKLDFIFPFPPASPAFRRNWALLSKRPAIPI